MVPDNHHEPNFSDLADLFPDKPSRRHFEISDPMFQPIQFDIADPAGKVVTELIDTKWFQRTRHVRQLSTTHFTFPYADHPRFGHLLGAPQLAIDAMNSIAERSSDAIRDQINKFKVAVVAAAQCHDITHMAPGSHLASSIYFPGQPDPHEEFAAKLVMSDPEIKEILLRYGADVPNQVAAILREDTGVDAPPAWTSQLISGGGWNVDRGHWTFMDSLLCGVKYGNYNPHQLINSLVITDEGRLAITERGLSDLESFFIARRYLYEQIYFHRVGLGADQLYKNLIKRAREIGPQELPFCDPHMERILKAKSPADIDLETVFAMREYRFEYHLDSWTNAKDPILSDLADRILNRRLFKMARVSEDPQRAVRQREVAKEVVTTCGFDPEYYLFEVATRNVSRGDFATFLAVRHDGGNLQPATELSHVLSSLASTTTKEKRYLVFPEEVRERFHQIKR